MPKERRVFFEETISLYIALEQGMENFIEKTKELECKEHHLRKKIEKYKELKWQNYIQYRDLINKYKKTKSIEKQIINHPYLDIATKMKFLNTKLNRTIEKKIFLIGLTKLIKSFKIILKKRYNSEISIYSKIPKHISKSLPPSKAYREMLNL